MLQLKMFGLELKINQGQQNFQDMRQNQAEGIILSLLKNNKETNELKKNMMKE